MTDLEQEFFKTFGIEPKTLAVWSSKNSQIENFESFNEYPKITDRVLLELICIYMSLPEIEVFFSVPTLEELRIDILGTLIENTDTLIDIDKRIRVYDKIQFLFREEGE